ncbi:MAG TPA: insulinase family protein [Gemmatimonadaceae bacterium]|nr:insulinase family protein [Gemmatimonadaceae bacterium]
MKSPITFPRQPLTAGALFLAALAVLATVLGINTPGSSAPFRDPELITGTLPNGMKYYLRPNRAPAHRAELRLAVNAGSALEDDDQQGFAHFLEHMAFNGTRHFPKGSLIDFVESTGMSFGADLNAYTSFDETVYMLTVPTDDRTVLDSGLTVLEDWASGGILIDSADVVAERGVVLGEWRLRLLDSANKVTRAHYDTLLFGNSRYLRRFPIGLPRFLRSASAPAIARFYRDWYRPDLMSVIAVGDFDPAWMESEIRRRFGAIPAARTQRPRPDARVEDARRVTVDVYHGEVVPRIDLLWRTPAPPRDAVAAFREELTDRLLTRALADALLEIRRRPSRAFVTAEPLSGRIARPLRFTGVTLIAWPDSLERALGVVLGEMERIAQHGLPEPALAFQKSALVRQLESEAAGSAARSSQTVAAEYVEHFLTGEGALATPTQRLALARQLLPAITNAVVAREARRWRKRDALKVLVAFPRFARVRPPTRESVLAVFDSVARTRLEPDPPRPVADGPLLDTLPVPGRIVGETMHPNSGITEWRLGNGARVLFKPTPNNPDEVLIRAWSPGGFSLLPDSLFFSTGRMVALMMTEAAGLGSRGRSDLLRQLATTGVREFKVDIGYADESIQLGGSPADLTTLFQMLHLQFTAPRLDTASIASWRSIAKYTARPFSLDHALDQVFARGEPRMLPVQTALADLVKIPEAMAVYEDRFGDAGDFTFTIVGAAPAASVKPLVERYLASLPTRRRAAREAPVVPEVAPFDRRVRERYAVAQVPRSDMLLVYDGALDAEPAEYLRERERLRVVTGVLSKRLRERLREQLGATYSPQVTSRTYLLPPEHFRVFVLLNTAPERMDEVTRETFAILDTLRSTGASALELATRHRIEQRRLEAQLQDNRFWLHTMELYERLGVPLDRVARPLPDRELTGAEFTAAARRLLPARTFIQLTAIPRDSTIIEEP